MIDSRTKEMYGDISSLKTDMGNVKGNVERIDKTVTGMMKQLLDAELGSLKGIKKQSAKVVRDRLQFIAGLLRNARQAGILADPTLVAEAGKDALELTKNPGVQNAAWNAIQQLLDYRSYFNSRQIPSTSQAKLVPNPSEFRVRYKDRPIPGVAYSRITLYFVPEWVPASEGAIFTDIGKETQGTTPITPRYFLLDAPGREVMLDGEHLRNVIVRHAKIVYSGGPVVLENVYFVNCSFAIYKNKDGNELTGSILQSAGTTFKPS